MDISVSIVTPSYQHGHYIEQTIGSVLEQDYPLLEHIVMDGGSTDNTIEILKRYEHRLKWRSEKDSGQADAINKGFALASGDILGWVNSDDYYAPGAIRRVAHFFDEHPEAAVVYGDVIGIDKSGRDYGVRMHVRNRQQIQKSDLDILVKHYDFIVQPGCFWRASVWKEIGELDISLRYVMDYEYWMRIAQRYSMHYLPQVLAYERLYGDAKTGSGSLARIEEMKQIAQRYGGVGLPLNYRAEAAAQYIVHALDCLLRREFSTARKYWASARAQNASPARCLRYLAVMLLLGRQSLPQAWLWLNRIRSIRLRHSQ